MVCVLNIRHDSGVYGVPLSASGRLVVGGVAVDNAPALPANQGGELPIYLDSVLLGSVPFSCSQSATKSTGMIGSANGAGAVEAWASQAGASIGRL